MVPWRNVLDITGVRHLPLALLLHKLNVLPHQKPNKCQGHALGPAESWVKVNFFFFKISLNYSVTATENRLRHTVNAKVVQSIIEKLQCLKKAIWYHEYKSKKRLRYLAQNRQTTTATFKLSIFCVPNRDRIKTGG